MASLTVLPRSLIFFNDNSSAGSANISNAGSITFGNFSNAGNASIVTQAGSFLLSFADSSTARNATITTEAGSQTEFTDNSTGGNARFIANAGGTVDFSGSIGPAGDGKITAGSIEGAGNYFIGGGNTLIVGSNNLSTEVSGVIADSCGCPGSGSLVKVGSGTLILSGTNTYTGTTDVSGGALGGTGTVGNTQVNGGGIFVPGAGVAGTSMTVAGNLAFQSGAFYLVQVNPATASSANVTGTASLAGTVQALLAPGSYARRSYDILHATGGLGGTTFDSLTVFPPNFAGSLSYTSTDVFLNLTAALGNGLPLAENPAAVANAISAFFNNGGTLPPAFVNLFFLAGGNLAGALTQLTGEAATGAQQGAFQLVSEFLSLMVDPFVDGRGGVGGAFGQASAFAPEREPLPEDIALAYAKVLRTPVSRTTPFEQRWSLWGGAFGGYNKTSGDPVVVGSHDLTARTAGVAAGMDYRLAPGTVRWLCAGRRRHRLEPGAKPWQRRQRCVPSRRLCHDALGTVLSRRRARLYSALDVHRPFRLRRRSSLCQLQR